MDRMNVGAESGGEKRGRAQGLAASLLLFVFAAACAGPAQQVKPQPRQAAAAPKPGRWQEGIASYYADVLHGRTTASGQPYDRDAATCAHRTHRFGTILEVQRLDDGRTVQCRVNDRGPFVKGRIVDLSRRLAAELGILDAGLTRVRIAPVH